MMNTKALREKILDLAMRGLLVPQDPTDEPASTLLERIQREKEQLVKEKKIKKQKPLPKITQDEIPYALPEGWEWVRLGEVIKETIGGGTPSKSNPNYWNGEIPWASVKDITSSILKSTQDTITTLGLENSSSNYIPKNNLIIVTRMAVGKIVINKIDTAINQDLRALLIDKEPLLKYLFYIYPKLEFETKGITVKGVSIKELLMKPLPLPSLAEQQRIVEKIEELFTLVDIIEENLADYEKLSAQLQQKVLDLAMRGQLVPQDPTDEPASQLLGRIQREKEQLVKEKKIKKQKPLPEITEEEIPYVLPKGWEWVRINNITRIIMGQSPKSTEVNSHNIGVEFHQGKLMFGDKKLKTSNNYTTAKNKIIEQPAVIMSVRAPVGDVNLIDRKIAIGRGLAAFTPSDYLNLQYLFYYLYTTKNFLVSQATGTTFKAVNSITITSIIFALPPLKEQQRIVEKIEEVHAILNAYN